MRARSVMPETYMLAVIAAGSHAFRLRPSDSTLSLSSSAEGRTQVWRGSSGGGRRRCVAQAYHLCRASCAAGCASERVRPDLSVFVAQQPEPFNSSTNQSRPFRIVTGPRNRQRRGQIRDDAEWAESWRAVPQLP